MLRAFLVLAALANGAAAQEPPSWQIDPAQSQIQWQATQNSAPIEGQFERFSAEIAFHPEALSQSRVRAVIDISSVTTAYNEAQSTLKAPDWLAAGAFPEAVYECGNFEALTADNQYRCDGTLTLKGTSLSIPLTFTLTEFSEEKAAIEGEATLSRTAFGIGWSDTAQIEDDVHVRIRLKASR